MGDKKLIVLGAGIVGFLIAFYLVFYFREVMDKGFEESPVVKESEKKMHDYEKWVEYNSKLTHFRARFPEAPQTDAQAISIAGKDSTKAALNVFVSEMPDQSTLMIKVTRFPDDYQVKNVKFQLDETMNAILNANKQNVLRDYLETTWQGHKALNFEVQNETIRILAKSIFANNAIYTLIYAATIGNYDAKIFENFLEGFVITTDFKAPKKTVSFLRT